MLTMEFDRLGIRPGDWVLDLGCGEGRHTVEAVRRGARVVSVDIQPDGLAVIARNVGGLGGVDGPQRQLSVQGDANRLPFRDGAFGHVICAETLEHIETDGVAIREITRVLRPGGNLAISVPRTFPERICWRLSEEYRTTPGGHVRIYRASRLDRQVSAAGCRRVGKHHAHALHSPYWWLRCVFGPPEESRLTRAVQRLLEWDLVHAPTIVGRAERLLNPLLGKSVVMYFRRLPVQPEAQPPSHGCGAEHA